MDFGTKRAASLVLILSIISLTYISSLESVPCYPSPNPRPKCPTPSTPPKVKCPTPKAKCPKDALKLGVCSNILGVVSGVVGTKPSSECCSLIKGMADLEAALCLCTALKANVLGVVKVDMPVAVSMVLNGCGKKMPDGFTC